MTIRVRKSAEDRKAEIVDAALRLADDIGPDRLSTDALAKAVGISQPGIFRHFPTKAKIWEAVAERIGERLHSISARSGKRQDDPIDQLRMLVIGHLSFIQKVPAMTAILFSRELHAKNDTLRAFFARMIASRQAHIARLIAAEIAAGRFDRTLNAGDAAHLILALIQGLAMRWSLDARGFDLVEEGRRLLELQLGGFTTMPRQTGQQRNTGRNP
ncbi:MAG: TetR family transcriptional regulator [Acetobacteraceae bacterium]|nr:TetR family transcriptional regulator [Acetobacteraceae bacterium]